MTYRLALALLGAFGLSGCVVTTAPPAAAPAEHSAATPAEHSAPATRHEPPPQITDPATPAAPPPRADRNEPPPRPRPPATRPAPHPAPSPTPPVAPCDPDAALLYAETTRAVDDPREIRRRFEVRASGAWSLTGRGETRRGCLEAEALEELEALLARADFRPPPPPEVTCMAMPTERQIYEDGVRGRRALIERPCGRQPLNPSVAEVSRLASSLVEPPDEPEVGLPVECNERAPLLASASVGPTAQGSGRAGSRGRVATRVRVATDGTWIRREGDDTTCGRLSRRELQELRARLRSADLRTIDQEIVCRALPTREYGLATSQGLTSWQTPCGSAAPSDDARELVEALLEISE
jgi:hypothetical protein